MSDRILIIGTLGFLSGILIGHSLFVGLLFAVPLLAGSVFFSRRHMVGFSFRMYLQTLLVFSLCVFGGVIRLYYSEITPPSWFEERIGETVVVEGVIANDPMQGDGVAVALIYLEKIGIRIKIKNAPELGYGDRIVVRGTLAYPENFETEQGTEFDYISYLRKDSILYLIQNAVLVDHQSLHGFSLSRQLYALRHFIEKHIFAIVPEQAAGLIAGILLGTKAAIPEDLYEDLVRTSTVHIIALSGYNVSIVAETITQFLKTFLRPTMASLFGGVGIILFVLMTGASSTAVRAGLMAVLVIIARIFGRPTQALRIMAIAASVLVFYNPWYIIADASFQLSFLATLGLVLVSPVYVSWLKRFMPPVYAEAVGTTLAAETAVAPFILYNMGVFSVVALPVNLLIIPIVPMIMLGGFIGILASFISILLGQIVAYPTDLLTRVLVIIITHASALPFASVTLLHVSLISIMACYIGITWYFVSQFLTKDVM